MLTVLKRNRDGVQMCAMRTYGTHLSRILLGLALIAALMWNLAHGAEVRWVQMDVGTAGTRAEIGLDAAAEYKLMRLSNPARLVVDFPASRLGRRFAPPPGMGVVRAVRSGQPVPGTVRLVFDLARSVAVSEPRLHSGPDGVWLTLEWPDAGGPAAAPQDDRLVWPVGDPAERIAIPTPKGTVPPLPAAQPGRQSMRNTNASPALVLDPIAQIAIATQTGAAEHLLRASAAIPVAVAEPRPGTPPMPGLARQMRPLVIAIDPGHGGRDPGAIGPGGTHEKTIVLAIARELARQIDATPGMRAHLIRNSDVYVALPRRAQLAREARADMFVSIHADAAENRNARGASVYTLSTTGASSQHARWLADRENSVDLIGRATVDNSTLSSVLLDLAHSGHMKASQDAAAHVLTGLSGVGKAHKSRVEYANFSVLRNADMPAMLVETGFISNATEEKRLKDPAYQRRVASAILDGINAFFRNQPPPGTLFAAHSKAHPDASGGLP